MIVRLGGSGWGPLDWLLRHGTFFPRICKICRHQSECAPTWDPCQRRSPCSGWSQSNGGNKLRAWENKRVTMAHVLTNRTNKKSWLIVKISIMHQVEVPVSVIHCVPGHSRTVVLSWECESVFFFFLSQRPRHASHDHYRTLTCAQSEIPLKCFCVIYGTN